jgi:hypothetical protein
MTGTSVEAWGFMRGFTNSLGARGVPRWKPPVPCVPITLEVAGLLLRVSDPISIFHRTLSTSRNSPIHHSAEKDHGDLKHGLAYSELASAALP